MKTPLHSPAVPNRLARALRPVPAILCAALILTLAAPPATDAAAPAVKPQQLTSPDQVPDGLAKSDWASIRAAYEAGRHAFQPIEGGWQARNPGQQWTTKFDGSGFVSKPRDGEWSWGLQLQSYGFGAAQAAIAGVPAVKADGQRLTYQWDANVQEWWVNDARGLEHGFTVKERPRSADFQSAVSPISNRQGGENSARSPAAGGSAEYNSATQQIENLRYEEISFTLAVRGTLTPHITADALGVEFRDAAGATVLNYAGLKVWDADGKVLPSRFEPASSQPSTLNSQPSLRLLVDERGARYPLTIDPIAQQAFLKSGNNGGSSDDLFGFAVAVSGDTVVVGAINEDSSTTGVNSTPNELAAVAGAAYVFVRSGTTWTQQAYLKPAAVGTTQVNDRFGFSVAVSGDTVVVGAPFENSSTTGVNSTPNEGASGSGAAYVFVRSGTTWSQEAYLKASQVTGNDQFGISVAVSSDTVVVGAHQEDSSTTGVNSTPNELAGNAGAAYVFTRSGTTWSQQAYLKPAAVGTTQAGDQFGFSAAVSGDTQQFSLWKNGVGPVGVQRGRGEVRHRSVTIVTQL